MLYRAIIADDEHLIRLSLSQKINAFPDVVAAGAVASGAKCLEWLERHYADICVTDVRMPHMDGLELIRHINDRYPWMICVVVSSYDDFSYVKKSMQLNAIDYIMKPIEQSVLHEVMGIAVERLRQSRKDKATNILMKKASAFAPMAERWATILQTAQKDVSPILVVDTLEMLESWIDESYFLLNELSVLWLDFIWERLNQEAAFKFDGTMAFSVSLEPEQQSVTQADTKEAKQVGLQPLTKEQARSMFRQIAVGRLEQGIHAILQVIYQNQSNSTHIIVEQIKQYLREHYAERVSLQDIADAVLLSRTYMANLFKQETGTTIWNYLISVRMEEAKRLLLNSSLKSYEIALKVGYENSIHFSKLFKEYYGLNPMEFKKRMLSG